MKSEIAKIAVIGGGIAGSSIAHYLARHQLDVTLFEKKKTLVDGPPMCHLHAGGNLYREISDNQCVTLLKESIELLRLYPNAIDFRPTVIAVPLHDKGEPHDLDRRLKLLQQEYQQLIDFDKNNRLLGAPEAYFKYYDRATLEYFKTLDDVSHPKNLDEWMVPVAKTLNLDTLKFPLVMVQEYGLNMFRIAASVTLKLNRHSHVHVKTETEVTAITKDETKWHLIYTENNTKNRETFDYLINAAGFLSGTIDDMLQHPRERHVEFKAAYVTQWKSERPYYPEIIFYGARGTPQGMAQFTPYPQGYFQLHGMTKEITLFEDGLVKSTPYSAQPQLNQKYINKIDKNWIFSEAQKRSQSAIDYLSHFIPTFKNAVVASKPLYGAQQIPGDDETLRASNVSFDGERYARCEIVKASSVLSMADAITKELIALGYVQPHAYGMRDYPNHSQEEEKSIKVLAEKLCQERGYPVALAKRVVSGSLL